MTKILIVEDDPAQSRLLRKAISRRRPDYSVLCSANGREAIALLEAEDIDLVLTDLQMSEMNGFELLAWLFTHRPTIVAFTMTAYGNPETQARLASLGSIECFTKPIDIAGVLRRFSDSVAQSIRGHVKNVGLASFLQLLEMEQKTCTLTVRCNDRVGTLFIRKGELLEARLDAQSGEIAATTIIGWIDSSITIDAGCAVTDRMIEKPMGFLVMEAMRLRDEIVRDFPIVDTDITRLTLPARDSEVPGAPTVARRDTVRRSSPPVRTPPPSGPRLGRGYVHAPVGSFVIAVADMTSGTVLACDGKERADIAEATFVAAGLLRVAQEAAGSCANHETIQELVIATRSRYELIRAVPDAPGAFVLLVFDPGAMNLMNARLEAEQAMATYLATATMLS